MSEKRKILLITTSHTGCGHKSISDALMDWFVDMPEVEVKLVDGFEDLVYECTVDSVQKQGNDRLVILEVSDPIGPLLNQRSGSATISAQMDGLYVPSGALLVENGQQGVRKYDGVSYTFVPVEVILSSSGRTLVAPLVAGTLNAGDYVLVG